jgi:outer membrane protein assembly factor BamA
MNILRCFKTSLLILLLIPAGQMAAEIGEQQIPTIQVSSLDFKIEGKTLEVALRRVMKIDEGMEFKSLEDFEKYLARDIQELKNLRIFTRAESKVDITPNLSGGSLAAITVFVTDTWSIFPFVVPSSQGSATILTMAVVDKNFAGTLTELRLSGDVGIGTDPLTGKFEVPRWGTYLDWSGIALNQWQFSTRMAFQYNTEQKFSDDVTIEDLSYYKAEFFLDVRYEFPFLRNLYYHMIPSVGGRFDYDVRVDSGKIEYEYFYLGLGQAIEYRKIDWYGFYRYGWSLGLLNALWGADSGSEMLLKSAFTGRLSGYGILGPLNPNARILGYYSINSDGTGLGRFLRGVKDNDMYGNKAYILNTAVQIRLFKGKLVEPHLQPFIDAGIAAESNESLELNNDFNLGIGSELILFFPKLPGLQIRGLLGFNAMVEDWSSPSKWEAALTFDIFY